MYKINFSNYVDHIFCNTYLPHNRLNKMIKRFTDIGIDVYDSHLFNFEYGIKNELFRNQIENFVNINNYKFANSFQYQPYMFELGMQIYHILKISQYMNYERIIIFEDDIAFLKDHKYIENAFDYIITTDFDIVHCDPNYVKMYRGIADYLFNNNILDNNDNEYFYHFINYNAKDICIYDAGFVILSKKAIETLINMIEEHQILIGLDMMYTWLFDNYMKELNIYSAKKSLGIQDKMFENTLEEIEGKNIYIDINEYE